MHVGAYSVPLDTEDCGTAKKTRSSLALKLELERMDWFSPVKIGKRG